jgi:hypothetical protein
MEEPTIRRRIREMLSTGNLPCEDPAQTWGGPGEGKHCSACLEPIVPGDIEYEVVLSAGPAIQLHRSCYATWLDECGREPPRPPRPAGR